MMRTSKAWMLVGRLVLALVLGDALGLGMPAPPPSGLLADLAAAICSVDGRGLPQGHGESGHCVFCLPLAHAATAPPAAGWSPVPASLTFDVLIPPAKVRPSGGRLWAPNAARGPPSA
jgi:hypothetical protein